MHLHALLWRLCHIALNQNVTSTVTQPLMPSWQWKASHSFRCVVKQSTVMSKPTLKDRFAQWITLDRATDLTVDIFLIIFDVLTHPILIVVRIFRWFMNLWFVDRLKRMARWCAHWFERKRAYRLAHGHGIIRTYWWLILLSPVILALIATPLWLWVEFKACWADPLCV